MSEHAHEPGLPLEQFITALTSQLDRAQNAMAIKARLGYPLTFAVKELTLDLRTHIDMVGSVVQIRPAAPGDGEASVIHLALTTITRPMMEENTMQLAAQPGEPTLQEALGDGLTDEEKRRLEWAGVQTVSQLVELEKHADPEMVSKIANVPAMRLRAALERASQPSVSHVSPIASPRPSFDDAAPRSSFEPRGVPAEAAPTQRLRILGRNLLRGGSQPQVSLAGRPLKILAASANELVVEAPRGAAAAGTLSVETQPGFAYSMELDQALASSVLSPSTGSTEANRSMDSGGSAAPASTSNGRASADAGPTGIRGSTGDAASTGGGGSTDVHGSTAGGGSTAGAGSTEGGALTDAAVRTDSRRETDTVGPDGSVGGSASTDMPAPDPADAGRTRRRGAGEAKRGGTGDVWALAPEGYHDMPPPAGGAKGAL